jgi:hypothetical protein
MRVEFCNWGKESTNDRKERGKGKMGKRKREMETRGVVAPLGFCIDEKRKELREEGFVS